MKKLLHLSLLIYLVGCSPHKTIYFKKDTHRKYKELLLNTESAKKVDFIEVDKIPFYASSISFDDHLDWKYGDEKIEYTNVVYFLFDLKKDIHIKTSSWTLDNRIKMMNTINTAIERDYED